MIITEKTIVILYFLLFCSAKLIIMANRSWKQKNQSFREFKYGIMLIKNIYFKHKCQASEKIDELLHQSQNKLVSISEMTKKIYWTSLQYYNSFRLFPRKFKFKWISELGNGPQHSEELVNKVALDSRVNVWLWPSGGIENKWAELKLWEPCRRIHIINQKGRLWHLY